MFIRATARHPKKKIAIEYPSYVFGEAVPPDGTKCEYCAQEFRGCQLPLPYVEFLNQPRRFRHWEPRTCTKIISSVIVEAKDTVIAEALRQADTYSKDYVKLFNEHSELLDKYNERCSELLDVPTPKISIDSAITMMRDLDADHAARKAPKKAASKPKSKRKPAGR